MKSGKVLGFFCILCGFLIACSSTPQEDVQDIRLIIQAIDDDTSLTVVKKHRRFEKFDSIVEILYSKNERLLKYELYNYLNDTAFTAIFYTDNDSVIYCENSQIAGKDTIMYSRLFFRHGVCVHADEIGEKNEVFRTSAFFAFQFRIDDFRKSYMTKDYIILPYSNIFPLLGYNSANTELYYTDLDAINAVVGDKIYIMMNHTHEGSSLKAHDFKRQYVAVLNDSGEKEVWINCFCWNNKKDWTKEVVDSLDSEGCYFHFKLNLKTRNEYDFKSGFTRY